MSELGILRSAVVRALEALEDGDPSFAEEILLSAVDDGFAHIERACCCSCGMAFEWPGLLVEHRRVMHAFDEVRRAA